MMIVGDKITKVDAQRGKLEAGIKIETKPEITKVTSEDLFAAGEKRTGALVEFKVNTSYGKSGHINLDGGVFITGEDKELKDLQKGWKKNKKLDERIAAVLLTKILEIGLVTSIPLSKTLGLPAPLQLPRVQPKQ
jgi:hypothetical protein